MILPDTSVWIDHLRRKESWMTRLLEKGDILCHPFVVGEIACGNLADRTTTLRQFDRLPMADVASAVEVRAIIERGFFGRGVGYVDMHLLLSTVLSPPARLWTRDRRLGNVAAELGIAYTPPTPG